LLASGLVVLFFLDVMDALLTLLLRMLLLLF